MPESADTSSDANRKAESLRIIGANPSKVSTDADGVPKYRIEGVWSVPLKGPVIPPVGSELPEAFQHVGVTNETSVIVG